MMKRKSRTQTGRKWAIRLAVALLLSMTTTVVAQQGGGYVLVQSTTTSSQSTMTGGSFALAGTVGQAEVNRWSGSTYLLSGGIWGWVSVTPSSYHYLYLLPFFIRIY